MYQCGYVTSITHSDKSHSTVSNGEIVQSQQTRVPFKHFDAEFVQILRRKDRLDPAIQIGRRDDLETVGKDRNQFRQCDLIALRQIARCAGRKTNRSIQKVSNKIAHKLPAVG